MTTRFEQTLPKRQAQKEKRGESLGQKGAAGQVGDLIRLPHHLPPQQLHRPLGRRHLRRRSRALLREVLTDGRRGEGGGRQRHALGVWRRERRQAE